MKKEIKENKKHNSLATLCIILVIIIMVLVGIIGYVIGRTDPRPAKSSYEVQTEEEHEIKDIDSLTELSTEIDTLLSNGVSEEYNTKKIFYQYGFRYGVLKNDLSNDNKQEIALYTVKWDKITGDEWKNNKTFKELNDQMIAGQTNTNWFIEDSNQITEEKLNEHAIDLFGEKITNPKEQTGKCPMFIYDKEQKMYFKPAPQCGGTAAGYIYTYKTKFVQKKNEAHVYVSFAYLEPTGIEYGTEFKIYKDFSNLDNSLYFGNITYKDEYKTSTYISPETNILTEDNYKEFSEYKFIFEQASNGNYYFVDIEQTK